MRNISVPASLRVGPFTSTVLVKKKYLICYIFLIWISVIPILLEFYVYWYYFFKVNSPIYFVFFFPLIILIMYVTSVLTSLIFSKILLIIVNTFHKPREGVFHRHESDKDYRYWSLRNTIKRWPVWLAHKFPIPFLDNLCFKMFGVKTAFSNSLFEGWVDCEFIEFGKNVIIGQASIIQSALIIGDMLIIRKTIIGNDVKIGAHTVVMPGTQIEDNCILAASSVTTVGQKLEEGWIYIGAPAHKYKKNRFNEDNLEERISHVKDIEALRDKYEEIYVKWYDDDISWTERKKLRKQKKEAEKQRMEHGPQ